MVADVFVVADDTARGGRAVGEGGAVGEHYCLFEVVLAFGALEEGCCAG